MVSIGVIRLGIGEFPGARAACQGEQIAEVISLIAEVVPSLIWFAADTSTLGLQLVPSRCPSPARLGTTLELIDRVRLVEQFEDGVLIGVPESVTDPRFRDGGVWTDDKSVVDLCDSIVEIRTFDTTFIEILSSEQRILDKLTYRFAPFTHSDDAPSGTSSS